MKRLSGLLPLLTLIPAAYALPPVPATPKVPVTEILHGEKITDDYRWLEGSAAPESAKPDPELDARVRAWSEAQNVRTRAYFESLPGRAALEAKLRGLLRVDWLGVPRTRGAFTFFARRSGDATNETLFVRGADGVERVLLDVDKLYPDGRTTLAYTSPSIDGARLAFGLYRSGDENTTLRVLDTATGKWLDDTITGKAGDVSWLPGGEAFVYSKLADIRNPYSKRILLHRIGEDPAKDRLIFEQYKTGPLATTYGPGASVDRSGRWLTMNYYTGTRTNDVWVYDFALWLKTGELKKIPITEGDFEQSDVVVRDDTMWMRTTIGAPNGRIFKIDLNNPARTNWKEIVPEDKARPLIGFSLSKSRMIVAWNQDALTAYDIRDTDGALLRKVELPGVGVAGLSTDPDSDTAYLSFSSFSTPPSIWSVDLPSDKRELYFRPSYDVASDKYEVNALFFPSKDGTRIPLFVAHRKGLLLDGKNPTLLYGYGGFGAGQKPGFSATLIPWLDAGGVYALAGLRGGNEFGEEWHKAGMLDRKQNVFDDCIGAAEFLIREKYTSPAHLGVRGGSNGGLLTGAMVTQRPDLFSAVIVGVPLLDMLRYPKFLMAKYWVPEYGDPSRPADFRWIRAYSPYHNVRDGVKYPATLLEAGEKDARVHPLHAKKMAARMQAAIASDPDRAPVLLWVDFDSGHGMGKSYEMKVRDTADAWLFLAKNLGLRFAPETR